MVGDTLGLPIERKALQTISLRKLSTMSAFRSLKTLISLMIILSSTSIYSETDLPCEISLSVVGSLSFQDFDQSLDSPWRCLAAQELYQEAVELIASYLEVNQNHIHPWDEIILMFHSGQLLAFDNRYPAAISHFERSFHEESSAAEAFLSWNSYIAGTIAFLEGDEAALQQAIDEVIAKDLDNDRDNLSILEAFQNCMNNSYKEVYMHVADCTMPNSDLN